jgi:hypothetical protein
MTLYSFDPGVKVLAYACFENSVLVNCHLSRAASLEEMLTKTHPFGHTSPDVCVVEKPQVYPQRHWRGDPNDLIQIALVAGSVASTYGQKKLVLVKPHDWKGTRDKDADNDYTMKNLTATEKQVVARLELPKTLLHNAIDAVGLGLWHLDRRSK